MNSFFFLFDRACILLLLVQQQCNKSAQVLGMDKDQESTNSHAAGAPPGTRLPKHVEKAATARRPTSTSSRARSSSPHQVELGSGEAARELLGDEHGAAWDTLDWANTVLGKNGDATSRSSSSGSAGSPLPSVPSYSSSRAFTK